jgi:hypothetical protein
MLYKMGMNSILFEIYLFSKILLIQRTDCRCGYSFGKYGLAASNDQPCSTTCSGNSNQICGDYLLNSIYSLSKYYFLNH